jgi:N utilization substance protein A
LFLKPSFAKFEEGIHNFSLFFKLQQMHSGKFIQVFADFARSRSIDRPTVIRILNDVFRAMIKQKYGSDEKFDIIINLESGDLQIWHIRKIVPDNYTANAEENMSDLITLSKAREISPDFEVGEELNEELKIESFGRRAIEVAKQHIEQIVKKLAKDNLYRRYNNLVGEIVTCEVHQILGKDVLLWDDDMNELLLPKSYQIPKDFFKKGDFVKALVSKVDLDSGSPKIILSRTSPLFLHKLMESEIPEIFDGLISVKKVVRDPGFRAKVAVESYDDRIDPVGACVGVKGARICSIARELKNESIDIINYTENLHLYVARSLDPAKVNRIEEMEDRIAVYLTPDQVPLAIGKKGQNIRLASKLVGKEIDVYREIDEANAEVVNLDEFTDQVGAVTIEALRKAGFETANSVLNFSKEELAERIQLHPDLLNRLYEVLS